MQQNNNALWLAKLNQAKESLYYLQFYIWKIKMCVSVIEQNKKTCVIHICCFD